MSASSYFHLEVDRIARETDAAFLVVLAEDYRDWDAGDEVWLPKSQVSDADDYEAGDGCCTISITEWLAKEKGFTDGE